MSNSEFGLIIVKSRFEEIIKKKLAFYSVVSRYFLKLSLLSSFGMNDKKYSPSELYSFPVALFILLSVSLIVS